jgi:hypothetical protein
VDLLSVEIHGEHCLFDPFAFFEARGAKHNVVGIPFAQTVVA